VTIDLLRTHRAEQIAARDHALDRARDAAGLAEDLAHLDPAAARIGDLIAAALPAEPVVEVTPPDIEAGLRAYPVRPVPGPGEILFFGDGTVEFER
jgi:hypothetical protein